MHTQPSFPVVILLTLESQSVTMPFTFRLSNLPKLDLQVDKGMDFEAWKTQRTSYLSLSGLAGESAGTKVQALTLCFSRETLTIVDNLSPTPEQKHDVDAIITAIKRHIDGLVNESMEHKKLPRINAERYRTTHQQQC